MTKMSINLIIFLLIICLLFTVYIFSNIFKRKISIPYSLMWFSYIALMIFALILPSLMDFLAIILGFEVTSNMIFFFGFMLLLFIAFLLTRIISKQKEEIANLTQEVAILKKDWDNHEKRN